MYYAAFCVLQDLAGNPASSYTVCAPALHDSQYIALMARVTLTFQQAQIYPLPLGYVLGPFCEMQLLLLNKNYVTHSQ